MLRKYPWSPYLGGAVSGLLLAASVILWGKYFGTSSAFVRISAMVTKIVAPSKVDELIYFIKHPPEPNWKVMFVLGMMFGALAGALLSGEFKLVFLPSTWSDRIGNDVSHKILRALVAFVGGFLIMVGARLAGGCPSGHGLSGVSTLSAGSMITMAGFIAGGVITARIVYKILGR